MQVGTGWLEPSLLSTRFAGFQNELAPAAVTRNGYSWYILIILWNTLALATVFPTHHFLGAGINMHLEIFSPKFAESKTICSESYASAILQLKRNR